MIRAGAPQMIPLEFVQKNERARVVDIEGDPGLIHRLEEMGLQVGAVVQMVQSGRPCILRIDNQRLSFRPEAATAIFVELLQGEQA